MRVVTSHHQDTSPDYRSIVWKYRSLCSTRPHVVSIQAVVWRWIQSNVP